MPESAFDSLISVCLSQVLPVVAVAGVALISFRVWTRRGEIDSRKSEGSTRSRSGKPEREPQLW